MAQSESWLTRKFTEVTQSIDQKVGWHRLPLLIALVILIGLRTVLRDKNLYDTTGVTLSPSDKPVASEKDAPYLTARTADGTYNDLKHPAMGSVGTRFGRNVPLQAV